MTNGLFCVINRRMVLLQAYVNSDVFGKGIFVALFALSILTWVVLIQKLFLFHKSRKAAIKMQALIQRKQLLHIGAEEMPVSSFSNIYLALKTKTLELLEKNLFFLKTSHLSDTDIRLIEEHAVNAISKETKTLEKNLFVLSLSVSLAPFIGILGTVWGILLCLSEMQKGGAVHSNSMILSGLSMALATTVIGLVVAIPAIIAYSYLKSTLRSFQTEMEDFSTLLLSTVELQYRKVS